MSPMRKGVHVRVESCRGCRSYITYELSSYLTGFTHECRLDGGREMYFDGSPSWPHLVCDDFEARPEKPKKIGLLQRIREFLARLYAGAGEMPK